MSRAILVTLVVLLGTTALADGDVVSLPRFSGPLTRYRETRHTQMNLSYEMSRSEQEPILLTSEYSSEWSARIRIEQEEEGFRERILVEKSSRDVRSAGELTSTRSRGPLVGQLIVLTRRDEGVHVTEPQPIPGGVQEDWFTVRLEDLVLPDEPVPVGETWSPDDETLTGLFGELVYKKGTAECTLDSIAVVDGVRQAVITLELDVVMEQDGMSVRIAGTGTFAYDLGKEFLLGGTFAATVAGGTQSDASHEDQAAIGLRGTGRIRISVGRTLLEASTAPK
jgi:hypothetical protein